MEVGMIRTVDIDQQMRGAYLDYAMSVIVARALPDARDGLKPVHRRILYAMHDMGLRPNSAYKKSARIVGEVLGKYHPHGDAAVYDAMARMAQDFSMRYPLVDGQGNFGSVDGDAPAAMRYTEARLARIAEELLQDIDKETINYTDNFDGTLQEPEVLPSALPNLLLNGSSGIAVGMATNLPPHNLGEIADAVHYLIDHWHRLDEVTVDDLMAFVQGPDFPTGALIVGAEGIHHAYGTGRGRIVMRAVTHIEEIRGGRQRIVVTELPYQVNKAALQERIAELVRDAKITDISDIRDESDRRGMSLIIELKRGAQPRAVLNQLLKYTPMQQTFGVQMLALVDGVPRLLGLKKALQVWIEHRQEVLRRRSEFELRKARQRAHILEGLLAALANLDAVIRLIRESKDTPTARQALITRFKLSEAQAEAILDMQLRRLAALERQKIDDEYRQVKDQIAYLEDLLAHPAKILKLIQTDLKELKDRYGDQRRTRILPDAEESLEKEDLVPQERVLVSITHRGYVKRMPVSIFRSQRRGSKAVTTREEDAVQQFFTASSLDSLLFFSDRGRVYQERAYQLPASDRAAKGVPLSNLLALDSNERITAVLPVADFEGEGYLTMVTRKGKIKRTDLSEFSTVRTAGLVAINLDEGDELGWVRLTRGGQEIVLATAGGQAIRFSEDEVRPTGRSAGGVVAIRLAEGDTVAGADVVSEDGELIVVTTRGWAKRTAMAEYPSQSRGGAGVQTFNAKSLEQTGPIVWARVIHPREEVTIITASGQAMRMEVATVPLMGRATRGSLLMAVDKNDQVASVARLGRDALEAGNGDESSANGHGGTRSKAAR